MKQIGPIMILGLCLIVKKGLRIYFWLIFEKIDLRVYLSRKPPKNDTDRSHYDTGTIFNCQKRASDLFLSHFQEN